MEDSGCGSGGVWVGKELQQTMDTATVDEANEGNEKNTPATSSAERCWIYVAIISALLRVPRYSPVNFI